MESISLPSVVTTLKTIGSMGRRLKMRSEGIGALRNRYKVPEAENDEIETFVGDL